MFPRSSGTFYIVKYRIDAKNLHWYSLAYIAWSKWSWNLVTTYRYLTAYKFYFKQYTCIIFRREAPLWTCKSFTRPVCRLLMQLCTEYSWPFLYCIYFLSLFKGLLKKFRILCTRMQKGKLKLITHGFAQSNMDKNIFYQHNIPPKLKSIFITLWFLYRFTAWYSTYVLCLKLIKDAVTTIFDKLTEGSSSVFEKLTRKRQVQEAISCLLLSQCLFTATLGQIVPV